MNQEIINAFEVIKNGGIILYPTDTVWGIGCDATNPEAVAKIYQLKRRAESKSMICLMNGEKNDVQCIQGDSRSSLANSRFIRKANHYNIR